MVPSSGDQNVTSPVFYVNVRLPIHLTIILTNEPCRAFGCDLIIVCVALRFTLAEHISQYVG